RVALVDGASFTIRRMILGETDGERFGGAIASPSDLDGDGALELAVSAPLAPSRADPSRTAIGRVVVYRGASLASPGAPEVPFGREGNAMGARLGSVLVGGGDFDGDGVSDLAIANAPPPQSGVPAAVSIVSGADGSLLARGPSRAASLAFAGDLDGGPGDELLIGIQGSPGGPQPGGEPIPGRVVILRFAGGGDPSTAAIVHAQIDAPEARSLFGASLAALGDVDGDGTADLAVGAPLAPSTDLVNVGRVTIYSGASLEPIHALFGIGSGQVLGGALAGPIDVDGDGRGDLLSSARRRGRNVARVFRLGDRDKNGLRDACESCAEAATLMPDGKPAVFSLCPVTPERCFIVR